MWGRPPRGHPRWPHQLLKHERGTRHDVCPSRWLWAPPQTHATAHECAVGLLAPLTLVGPNTLVGGSHPHQPPTCPQRQSPCPWPAMAAGQTPYPGALACNPNMPSNVNQGPRISRSPLASEQVEPLQLVGGDGGNCTQAAAGVVVGGGHGRAQPAARQTGVPARAGGHSGPGTLHPLLRMSTAQRYMDAVDTGGKGVIGCIAGMPRPSSPSHVPSDACGATHSSRAVCRMPVTRAHALRRHGGRGPQKDMPQDGVSAIWQRIWRGRTPVPLCW